MINRRFFSNILITIFMMMPVNFAFADSYIMVSPEEIKSVECQNNSVIGINLLSTLMNERKSVIVTSLTDGYSAFSIKLKHRKCDYKAYIKDGKMTIKGDKYIKVLPVDLPPELILDGDTE